jgi:hypothetical protein
MQNPADLTKFKDQAVDLDKAMEERKKEQAAKEAAAMEAAQKKVIVWEKAMRRAFKGIMPRPTRRAFMQAHLKRLEREQGAA